MCQDLYRSAKALKRLFDSSFFFFFTHQENNVCDFQNFSSIVRQMLCVNGCDDFWVKKMKKKENLNK